MAAETLLFKDIAIVLLVSGAAALLFYWLKQPVVLGYLAAGFIVGPFSPGPSFVGDGAMMHFLGELGIIFLLFALGLEFNLAKLRKVGLAPIIAGTLEISIMLWLGYSLGGWFGWSPLESIFLGAVMSISSTTVIVKVLAEMGQKDKEWAQLALGILIMEDILAVLILTGLSSAGATGNFQPELITGLVVKLTLFLGAALLVGLMIAPRAVDLLARLKVEEVLVVASIGMGFGVALLAAELGFSAGLGAFVAGALMAESRHVDKIEHKIAPLRDVFVAIFFVTIGALVDPRIVLENWGLILAVTAAVIIGKVGGVSLAAFLAGTSPSNSLRVGTTLAQIGEFGFIIAALGASLAVTSPRLLPTAIAVAVLTTFLTPYLIRSSDPIIRFMNRRVPLGVRAFATTYRGWLGRLRSTDKRDPELVAAKRSLLVAGLSAMVMIAVIPMGSLLSRGVVEALQSSFGVHVGVPGVELILITLGVTPFALVTYTHTKRMVAHLARLAVPPRLRSTDCTQTERILRRTFALLAAVVLGGVVLLVASPFVGSAATLLLVAGGVIVTSTFLGQSLQGFHAEVENTVARLVGARTPGAADEKQREDAIHLIEGAGAFGAGSREVYLPTVSGGVGRTIAELRLRALTGASVVRVTRGREPTLSHTSPGPDFRFTSGDRILLVGDPEAIVRAEEILLGQELGVEGGATEVTVPQGSLAHGRTLAALRFRERAGVEVLIVRRGGTLVSASPDLALVSGDVLVVAGDAAHVAGLRALIAGSPEVAEREALA